MKKKNFVIGYEAPAVEFVSVAVEKGFALSTSVWDDAERGSGDFSIGSNWDDSFE